MADNLTIRDASALADILNCKTGDKRVARLMRDADTPIVGVPRSFGTADGCADFTSDVRDTYLRVTSLMGFEYYWKMSELIADYHDGYFVVHYGHDA